MKMKQIFVLLCCATISTFANAPIFIGIAGGTGSGKTTLAEKIHEIYPESILICEDSYYKDLSHLPMDERAKTNFDHPDSLEFSLLREHLLCLKNNIPIEQPIYSFHFHGREEGSKTIEPARIVLVEGILLLAAPEMVDLFDIKIFVDTPDDVRILRRIERDMRERARNLTSIKDQYLQTVKPMHDAFVEPSKRHADIIVPGDKYNQVALDLILTKLKGYQNEG